MGNTAPPKDFEINVDPSCSSDGSGKDEVTMEQPAKEEPSETQGDVSPDGVSKVVHHDSSGEGVSQVESPQVDGEEGYEENIPSPRVEPHKATVEDVPEEESLPKQAEQVVEDEKERAARERQMDHIEAQIQAAATAVVASIEKDNYPGGQDSEPSRQTEESYDRDGTDMALDGTEVTYDMGTELIYNDETEATCESDHDNHSKHDDEADPTYGSQAHSEHEGGDSSSHHDGDMDDDVFSHSGGSKRSSMNSDLHSSDDNQKMLTSPVVGEEAGSAKEMETISRVPSASSYVQTAAGLASGTPSKSLARPPFRTPSSVRAMQMSSPTQSVFACPRSAKRHVPTVSRIGTPNSQYSPSKRTPTRFKAKKEPLVLLHVTVLPLQWPYSRLMSSPDVPDSLHTVKESWRLLQEKLGDTVLERGILLPHPQDSYEVLEERLLEALELPVRPRAKILRCGHYMGPSESEAPSSDEDDADTWSRDGKEERRWCEICMRDVRLETVGDVGKGERRFRVKIYASNGLMRAGAWAAAWREMERVDVELEPYVEMHLNADLEHLDLITQHEEVVVEEAKELDDGFEDEEMVVEDVQDPDQEAEKRREEQAEEEEEIRLHEEEARLQEEEARLHEEEQMRKQLAIEEELRQRMVEEEEMMQRKAEEDQRMHEMYGTPEPPASRRSSSRASVHDDSSLPELLLAALKVAVRDSKNVAIGVLSVLVLLLALRPKSVPESSRAEVIMEAPSPAPVATTVFTEPPPPASEPVSLVGKAVEVGSKPVEPEPVAPVTTTVYMEPAEPEPVVLVTTTMYMEPAEPEPVVLVTTTVYMEPAEPEPVVPVTTTIYMEPAELEPVVPVTTTVYMEPSEPEPVILVTTTVHMEPAEPEPVVPVTTTVYMEPAEPEPVVPVTTTIYVEPAELEPVVPVTTTVYMEPSEPEPVILVTTTVYMEPAEPEPVVPVTTTVYMELTVTEKVPVPTIVNLVPDSLIQEKRFDPCETPVKSQKVIAAPVADDLASTAESAWAQEDDAVDVSEPALKLETEKDDILSIVDEEGVHAEESQVILQ